MMERKSSAVPKQFLATIYRIWMMRHVDVPEDISRALLKEFGSSRGRDQERKQAKPKYIPVVAIVNGRSARTTLVPAGGGRYRLQIITVQRKAARADVGDMVSVEIRIDRASRSLPLPEDLRAALAEHPKARRAFKKLPAGQRRQFLLYLQRAKRPETRKRQLNRLIDILLERAILSSPVRARRKRPGGRSAS
jgi:hypothetical protein